MWREDSRGHGGEHSCMTFFPLSTFTLGVVTFLLKGCGWVPTTTRKLTANSLEFAELHCSAFAKKGMAVPTYPTYLLIDSASFSSHGLGQ